MKLYLSDKENYGTSRHFGTKEEAEEFEMNGHGKGLGTSLQILHAQNRLLKFLIHCCENTLSHFDSESLTSDQYPVKAEPPALLADNDVTASFVHATAMQPFLAPDIIDFSRMRHLMGMTVRSSEEHVWLLREHPGYFAETYENIINTDTAFLEDVNETPSPDPSRMMLYLAHLSTSLRAHYTCW